MSVPLYVRTRQDKLLCALSEGVQRKMTWRHWQMTEIGCRCSLWSSWTPVCRRFRWHMNAVCLCGRLYVVTLFLMFHKTAWKIKSRKHEAKKDVPAVYFSSAAGWRPWPDLCIAPCNGSVNTRAQCRWWGGGHTVGGKWGERYLNRVCTQARVKLLFTERSVSLAAEQRRNTSSTASLLPSPLHPLSLHLPERGVTVINGLLYNCNSVSCVRLELSKLNLFRFPGK